MRRSLILLLFFVIFITAVRAEVNCQIHFVEPKVMLGVPVDAQLIVWPKESVDQEKLASFLAQSNSLVDTFYINSRGKIKISENNSDALVVDLELVLIKLFDPKILPLFSDGSNSCTIEWRNLELINKKVKPQLTIINQHANPLPEERNPWRFLFYFLAIVLTILIAYLLFKWWKKREREKKIALRKEYFSTLFANALEREDYERIYKMRDEWIPLLQGELSSTAINEFFRVINDLQYKKEWSPEELAECQQSFKKLKGGTHA